MKIEQKINTIKISKNVVTIYDMKKYIKNERSIGYSHIDAAELVMEYPIGTVLMDYQLLENVKGGLSPINPFIIRNPLRKCK